MATRDPLKRSLNTARYRQKRREQIISFLGGKCAKCEVSDPRVLQIDHVESDGSSERKLSIGQLYRKILSEPHRYQLLCANHNWIKRFENKEHPGPKYLRAQIPICHPQRKHQAKGLCQPCYDASIRKRSKRPSPKKSLIPGFQMKFSFPKISSTSRLVK